MPKYFIQIDVHRGYVYETMVVEGESLEDPKLRKAVAARICDANDGVYMEQFAEYDLDSLKDLEKHEGYRVNVCEIVDEPHEMTGILTEAMKLNEARFEAINEQNRVLQEENDRELYEELKERFENNA